MYRSVVFALASASLAFAGTDDIAALIKSKLSAKSDAVVCAGQSLFCPIANVPSSTFPAQGGSVSSQSTACCPALYTQCEVQDNTPYCRDLVYYEITAPTGNSEEQCPSTTPQCVCQQSLSGERQLSLTLCPQLANCCPNCECHGDPHCRSFSGQQAVWATCDDRDSTCVHNHDTCVATKYDGQFCQWVVPGGKFVPYCARADSAKTPTMVMYTKSYKSYFNPSDNTEYTFTLTLQLGTYGSITNIQVVDTGVSSTPFTWYIDSKGQCQGNPTYPVTKGLVSINNLPSMVNMIFECQGVVNGRSPTNGRYDILQVQDPWYIDPHPPSESFGGFCATGTIAEAVGEITGSCNTVDRQLTKYFGCNSNGDLTVCKRNWCNTYYKSLDYSTIAPTATTPAQMKAACLAFVTDSTHITNYMAAVCSISNAVANGVLPQNPAMCESNDDCKSCMDDILDYPDEIATILQGAPAVTASPTSACTNALQTGLNRKSLSPQKSGVEIDFFDTTTSTWTPVFALFNEELAACGCKPITASSSDSSSLVLMQPGKYRMKQCSGLNPSPDQDLCVSAPGYNATVSFSNPLENLAVSTPYGQMVDDKTLVCSRAAYPGCPVDFQCCIWPEYAGWNDCMVSNYGSDYATKYKTCTAPPA